MLDLFLSQEERELKRKAEMQSRLQSEADMLYSENLKRLTQKEEFSLECRTHPFPEGSSERFIKESTQFVEDRIATDKANIDVLKKMRELYVKALALSASDLNKSLEIALDWKNYNAALKEYEYWLWRPVHMWVLANGASEDTDREKAMRLADCCTVIAELEKKMGGGKLELEKAPRHPAP